MNRNAILVAASALALAAVLRTGLAQQAPAPAPIPTVDPTEPDEQLLGRRPTAPRRGADGKPVAATERPAPTLRGLVVTAAGTGSALIESDGRLLRVSAGSDVLLDVAGTHRAEVVSLDVDGVVLKHAADGQFLILR